MVEIPASFSADRAACSWESPHASYLSAFDSRLAAAGKHEDCARPGFQALAVPDQEVVENRQLHCRVVRPTSAADNTELGRVCVLLHGLNERGWEKYLPWAQAIADRSDAAVILFPIAFHMDRSPAAWADFGIMRGVSKDRIARYPGLKQSSMANSAISERLDEDPGRFYLSGLMSALDLQDLLSALRAGRLPGISPNAQLGYFGYSIGAYLLQCLSLASADFAAAGRRFLFCGGPYLSGMTPISKFIMDSQAHARVLHFWIRDLQEELAKDPSLAALVGRSEGAGYLAMVDPTHPQGRRNEVFSDGNWKVASLSGDEVMPRQAILDSFQKTSVVPSFIDLPASCTHISPFNPLGGEAVEAAFIKLFAEVSEHLFG